MKLRFALLLLPALVILFPPNSFPDSIILKNGQKIESERCWDDGAMIKCKRYGATIGYQKNDIAEIVMLSAKDNPKIRGRQSFQKSPIRRSIPDEVDEYRLEIAYKVQKYWVFESDGIKHTGRNAIVSITFKVLPDGRVSEIHFQEQSRNTELNESARAAIKNAAPFPAHPESYSRPYLQMGLRFTPSGIQ